MRPRRWEHSRSEAVAQALRDGPSEAQLDAALRQLPDAPLPVGFVARAVEEATGWPRFRIEARDVVLPSTVGASTALSVGLVARAAGGEGPLWLQQVALWFALLVERSHVAPPATGARDAVVGHGLRDAPERRMGPDGPPAGR